MLCPFSIKISKCNGNCNSISNLYSRVCVPNVVKNITAKMIFLFATINKNGIKTNADVNV